jgi:GMP synthase (glutamine-hydrolysing)
VTALVITHTATEPPGHLETWFAEAGLGLQVLEPWRGEELPPDLDGFDALVSMGGPQQAYDDSSAPWLRDTKRLLRTAVAQGVPVLGVCLGAQLLAEAAGGRVAQGEAGPELGARLVGKRDEAGNDPLFWDLPLSPLVVQWHWDAVVELPPGATLLMSSPRYAHQAFRVGDAAWGVQFHVEAPAELVELWVGQEAAALADAGADPQALLDRTLAALPEVEEVWGEVIRRFARFALDRRP